MSYCTQADLEAAFGLDELLQRTDRNNDDIVDIEVLTKALANADADINKRLRVKGWSLELLPVSDDLRHIACDLTRFYLYDDAVPESIEKAFMRRLGELDTYVRGELAFDIGQPMAEGVGDIGIDAPPRIFDQNTLKGF